MSRYAIVGGGFSGLVAAREVKRVDPAADTVLFEATARLGGAIGTIELDGAVVETGPDWFVTRNPAALELCRAVGLEDALVAPAASGAKIYSRGRLWALPEGAVRGFPASVRALARAHAAGLGGRLRASLDLVARSPLVGPDVAIGDFARHRLGAAFTDRVIDPIIAASRAGSLDEVSLAAAAPEIDGAARSGRSVIRSLARERDAATPDVPFLGLKRGMTALVDALRSDLSDTDVRTNHLVARIERDRSGYRIDGTAFDGVVVSLPAPEAARVLAGIDASLAARLARIPFVDATVVTLLNPPGAARGPEGMTGVLVPSRERRFLTAFAWYSAKWAHAVARGGGSVVRCFVGRSTVALHDDEVVAKTRADLAAIAGIGDAPLRSVVTRHRGALPVYRVGHPDLVASIERGLPPGLALAGAGYRGSGLPDLVDRAQLSVRAMMDRTAKEGSHR